MNPHTPYHPIIYVRGFAATQGEIEETCADPYMGFNLGSTKARQIWTGDLKKFFFESPMVRLQTDHEYSDVYFEGEDLVASDRADTPLRYQSVVIYRYYDEASEAFSEDRTQRNTLALRDVEYVIEAAIALTPLANQPRRKPSRRRDRRARTTWRKYLAMFQRRAEKGQCFTQPCFGCREFPAHFEPADAAAMRVAGKPNPDTDLGLMLYDVFDLDVHATTARKGRETRSRASRSSQRALSGGVVNVPDWTEMKRQLGGARMMLQALIAYAERERTRRRRLRDVGVRWLIPLDAADDSRVGPIPLGRQIRARKSRGPKTMRRPFTSPNELNQGRQVALPLRHARTRRAIPRPESAGES